MKYDILHYSTTLIESRGIKKQKTFGIGGVRRKPIMNTTSYQTSPSSSKIFFLIKGSGYENSKRAIWSWGMTTAMIGVPSKSSFQNNLAHTWS